MDDADVTAARLLRAVHLAVLLITVAALGLGLSGLLRNLSSYRWPAAQFAACAVLVCVAAVAGRHRIKGNRSPGRARWLLLAGVCGGWVVNAVDVAPSDLRPESMWCTYPAVWFVLMLLLDRGFRVVTAGLAVAFAASTVGFHAVHWSDHASTAEGLIMAAGTFGYQVGVVLVAELLRRIAVTQARSARGEERLRTASAVADALHRDRLRRYAELGAVPLLTGLAAGVLDPSDERVRASCAAEAARMRRLLAEHDDVPDPLLHELRACADTAERRGVTVYLGTCGSYPCPPLAARRALTEPAVALLATAASHARVTVIGSATAVTVSVVADSTAPGAVTRPAAAGVTTTRRVSGDRLWMEATWRTTS